MFWHPILHSSSLGFQIVIVLTFPNAKKGIDPSLPDLGNREAIKFGHAAIVFQEKRAVIIWKRSSKPPFQTCDRGLAKCRASLCDLDTHDSIRPSSVNAYVMPSLLDIALHVFAVCFDRANHLHM